MYQLRPVGEFVDGLRSHSANATKNAEKPPRATVLADPLPGTVAQADCLPNVRFAVPMKTLSYGVYGNWVIWRGYQKDGSTADAVNDTREKFGIYPLSQKDTPRR